MTGRPIADTTKSPENVPQTGLPARKHLAYLGQFLLALFMTALFFQLRISDSRAIRDDFESITALASFAELPVHRVLAEKVDQEYEFAAEFDKAVQSDVTSWLKEKHAEVDRAHRQSRDTVVEWLREGGLTVDQAGNLSGKGHRDSVPFLFFRTGVAPLRSRFGHEADLIRNPPVGLLLDEIRHLGHAVPLVVVQEVRPSDLPPWLNFGISQDEFGRPSPGRKSYRLESVVLNDSDRLVSAFVENTGVQQRAPERESRVIPVVTRTVSSAPILEIISPSLHAERLTKMATDEGRYNYLYGTYGSLRLDNARTMTGNRMLDSFQNVNILGFSFSPKYFWVFTFAFLAAALLAVAVHLRRGLPDDEPTAFGLHALLDHVAFRVLLWCVIPLATMLLAIPQGSAPLWILTAYSVACIGLAATGVCVVWLSLHAVGQKG